MYSGPFNELAEHQKQAGRQLAPPDVAAAITGEYMHRYAQSPEKSSDIVRDLSSKFPGFNVPEALRPIIDFNRE